MDQSSLKQSAVGNQAAGPARSRRTRSDRLLELLANYEQVLVVTHDTPDPDAVASGWGVLTLVKQKLDRPGRLVAGGAVVRAENRRMIELLRPPMEFADTVEPGPGTAVVLVDCVPANASHVVRPADSRSPVAVIDHHAPDGSRYRAGLRDVRPRLAATATIVAQYLRDQRVQPAADLATALLYGIRTDAWGTGAVTARDQRAAQWLSQSADFNKLADIESAPLTRAYFADLLLALEGTLLYDDAALCFLPQAAGAEIVGEVADLLIRCVGVRRVLCAAVIGEDVLLAVRTGGDGGDASALVREVLRGIGHGGGHRQRAGGKLSTAGSASGIPVNLQGELRERWLRACGSAAQRGTRLVPPREIARNL